MDKSKILNETAFALIVAALAASLGVVYNFVPQLWTLIVGFIISVGCIFGVRMASSVILRKSMLWFVAAFMGISLSSKLVGASFGMIATAMIITAMLTGLASVIYSKFSVKSLMVFSLAGLLGLIGLAMFGIQGTWVSAIGVIVYFACIMYDFHNMSDEPNAESGAMGLVISVIGLFQNIRNFLGD